MAKKNGKGKNGKKGKGGKKNGKKATTQIPSTPDSKNETKTENSLSEEAIRIIVSEDLNCGHENDGRGKGARDETNMESDMREDSRTRESKQNDSGSNESKQKEFRSIEASESHELPGPHKLSDKSSESHASETLHPHTPQTLIVPDSFDEDFETEDETKDAPQSQRKESPLLNAKALRPASSPPLAISTPLQENYSSLQGPYAYNTTSETLPLLSSPQRDLESGRTAQKPSPRSKVILLLAAVVAVALLAFVGLSSLEISDIVEQGFTPNAKSVSVVSVNDEGVCMQVTTNIASHYSMIRNPFLRFSMYMAAAMVGKVSVASADKCEIYVGAKGLSATHVISASIPRLPINLANNQISEVQFNTSIVFQEQGLAVLGEYLENCHSPAPEFDVTVKMDAVIQKNLIRFTRKGEELNQKVLFNIADLAALSLRNLSLSLSEEELRLSVSAYAARKFPIDYHLQKMQCELSVPDCESKLHRLGVFNTSGVHITPHAFPFTDIDMLISEVAPELLEECSDGVSPFNKFMSSLANENLLCAYVNTKPGQDVPKWLSNFLQTPHKVTLPIPADLSLSRPFFPGEKSCFEDLSVVISSENDKLLAWVSTKASMAVVIPLESSGFHAQASKVNYTMQVYDSESANSSKEIMTLSEFGGEISLTVEKEKPYPRVSALFPNTMVEVQNPTEIGHLINGFLNGSLKTPRWSAHIFQADVSSKLLTTRIKDLVFNSEHFMRADSIGRSIVDEFLANMNTKVENIVVASTSKNSIEILVDFEISNCLNVSLEISEPVSLNLSYNGTTIGTAELANFELEDGEKRQSFTSSMSLYYDSEPQRVLVEEFLSHVISGSNATYIGVSGKPGNSPLHKMLQEVEIPGLKVPEIAFKKGPDAAAGGSHTSPNSHTTVHAQSSPFLLGATIHLWSSEIEVTILNPLSNMEINARIESCIASYDGHMLAHIEHSEVVVVPPGVYKTPRIPVEISSGIGADILRRALNGDLAVDVVAEIRVLIGQFPAEVVYRGSGLTAQIKI